MGYEQVSRGRGNQGGMKGTPSIHQKTSKTYGCYYLGQKYAHPDRGASGFALVGECGGGISVSRNGRGIIYVRRRDIIKGGSNKAESTHRS